MINNIKAFSKFLDQPMLISKFNKTMPSLLVAGSSLYLIKQHKDEFKKAKTFEEKKEINKNTFKKSIVLFGSILSALFAPKIASKITKRGELESLKDIIKKNTDMKGFNSLRALYLFEKSERLKLEAMRVQNTYLKNRDEIVSDDMLINDVNKCKKLIF